MILKVDCEYNRYLDEIKTMPRAKEDDSGAETTNRWFPDVIVHRRRDKSQNLLVCEIKKKSTSRKAEIDTSRIKYFTESDDFHYELGAFLLIDQLNETILVQYYIGGNEMI